MLHNPETLRKCCLAAILLFSINAIPANAQSRAAIRGAISHPAKVNPSTSFYPVVRNPQPAPMTAAARPGWTDMGNGARIRFSEKNFAKESGLSPDVLETLKSLQVQTPKPAYQLAPATPITGAVSQSLQGPDDDAPPEQREIGVLESKITFPPGKNIRIQDLDFRNTTVQDALRSLAQLIEVNLMLSPTIAGNVTILFSDVTLEEAFNTLLTSYDLSFAWEGTILRIFPKAQAPLITKIFPIQHTNATEIKTIVDRMLTPQRGTSEIDARTNSLMVTDTATKLAEVKSLLPQLDVKESTVDISSRPLTEVFYLNYADATTLKTPITMLSTGVQIQEFSSSSASQAGAAGGGATTGRMDMMIITDTQNNLQRIRELIEKLDIPPIQVTIDAHIYEIDKNEEERLGINWQKSIPVPGTTNNLFEMTIAPEDANAGGTGVFRFGSLDINQFTALLAMLKTHSFAKVLSNPVITTLNNRQANITVGQSIPYVSASQVNAE
ncbi:MAG: secretin N-terminal domain-containing protein, partial [Candidatus Rifleibacteriota bacterium]